ncbi:MAG: amino acid permease [Gammaproteobacteria bacterium]|jgi:amino acid transporter
MQNNNTEPHLKRSISLPLVTFYGIGTILGAGIYVLVGKVAGEAGMATPFAFLLASLLAGFSAFSYAELSSRYPRSAGEAVYLHAAFGIKHFSLIMGLLIITIGLVSAATMIHGFVGYLGVFIDMSPLLTKLLLVVVLASIVTWGIGESIIFASLLTIIEIVGLLIIVWVTKDKLAEAPMMISQFIPPMETSVLIGVFMGAFIAFYAFVGFEDIVNVAEEVIDPVKNVPRAVIWSLVVTTLFYFIISTAAVVTLSPEKLASSDAPLAMIYEHQTGQHATVIAVISLLSVINGALIQIVMASRVLYGLSEQHWIPAYFGHVNKTTRTPINATLVVSVIILILVMWLPLLSLAKITSLITLIVFALINLALFIIKLREQKHEAFSIPLWVPLTGFITCSGFVFFQLYHAVAS